MRDEALGTVKVLSDKLKICSFKSEDLRGMPIQKLKTIQVCATSLSVNSHVMSIFSVKIAQRLRRGWQGSLFGNRDEVYEMWGEQACGYVIAMQSLRSVRSVRNNTAGMSLLPNADWTDEFHISTLRFLEHFHQRWTTWSYRRTLFMKTFFPQATSSQTIAHLMNLYFLYIILS